MGNNTFTEDQNKEGLGTVQDYFTIDSPDGNLVKMIDRNLNTASSKYEKLKKEGKRNEQYWMNDQLKGISLRWHNSRITTNIVYMGVETMIPIITSKPAEPVISIADEEEESEDSREFTRLLEKMLMAKYNDQDYPQQELFEMVARHLLLYKLGSAKLVWYENIDDYIVEFMHPHKAVISSDGHYNHDVWVAQYLEKTVKEIVDEFPDKEEEILNDLFPGSPRDILEQFGNTPVGLWEYWSEDGEYIVWKMQNVILQKKLNPYIIWTDDKKFDKKANHFDYSHKPFIFLNSQNLGRHIWDDTTPVSQIISIQDGINMTQRIITDTSRDQGIIVGAQELIDRDELYKYTGAPDEKLSVKGADPTRALYRIDPKQLAPHVQNNLQHLLSMGDNIMGTHATTRGAKSGAPTLGQDLLYKESDYGRIDAIVRGLERFTAEVYNWEVQMMMAKYKVDHYKRVLGNEEGKKLFDMMKEYNARGIKIIVKPGSTLPTDKISQRQEALDLARMGKISDLDLFKRMDFPNPMEMAKNVFMQNNAPEMLYPDLMAEINASKQAQPGMPPPGMGPMGMDGGMDPNMAPPGMSPMEGGMPPGMPPPQAPIQPPMGDPMMGQQQPPLPPPGVLAEGGEQLPTPALFGGEPQSPDLAQLQQDVQMPGVEPSLPQPGSDEELGMPTEHTQALIEGRPLQAFEGIDPAMYEDHLAREFAFISGDQFLQLPQETQVRYAQHTLLERNVLKGDQPTV